MQWLAYAEASGDGSSGFALPLACIGVVVSAIVLGLAVCGVALRRRHGRFGMVLGAAVVWAVVSGGSVIYFLNQQANWQAEYNLELQTGYLDPANKAGKPMPPVGLWIGLGVAYGGIWVFVLKSDNKPVE